MRRRWLLLIPLLLAVGVAVWLLVPSRPKPDLVAAAHANARGVGHMEQFQYGPAREAFEEAVRLAPDWTPAQVNRGIALFNTTLDADLAAALDQFADVLKVEPDNPHAHFCRGIVLYYKNDLEAAHAHFRRVTEIDPADAHARYFHGLTQPDEPQNPAAKADYRKALDLNPYLNAARYKLAQHLHEYDEAVSKKLLAEHRQLIDANWEAELDIKYTLMGKYGGVIGTSPAPRPAMGPVPVFEVKPWGDARPNAKPGDLSQSRAFFLGSAAEHLVMRASAVAVADFDNDGRQDFILSEVPGLRLIHQGLRFATEAAGLDVLDVDGRAFGWVDLDQDGDLDLVMATDKGLLVFLNVGESPPTDVGTPPKPLTVKFQPATWPAELKLTEACVGIAAGDLDGDGDVDLLVFYKDKPAERILNDRLNRFHRGGPVGPTGATGALMIDVGAEQSGVVFVHPNGPPVVLLPDGKPGKANGPALKEAHRCDLDLDGRADLVGISTDGKLVFLQGDGDGGFTHVPEAFGPMPVATPLLYATVLDHDGDGFPDVFAGHADGWLLVRNLGNGNHGLSIKLTGKRDRRDGGQQGKNQRTNADGIGSRVYVHAGPLRTMIENTTLSAGPNQSRVPLILGIGKATAADAVRIRWPDMVTQAELNVRPGAVVEIVEDNRKPTSCPVLFTWDGTKFAFVTDCLGGGATGETGPDGGVRPPRPEESVKIEPHQLALKDGRFVLKLAEPMDEVMYLDHLRLDMIDHPAAVAVYPDERFVFADPLPTQQVLAFRNRLTPTKATDHRGRDVTATLRERDGVAVEGFAVRSWLGYAEEHWVECEFGAKNLTPRPPSLRGKGEQAGAGLGFPPPPFLGEGAGGRGSSPRLFLALAGWTEYPYPESMFAATQAGVALVPPTLEQKQSDESWKSLGDIGFPAGLPRVMTVEVTGKLDPAGGPVRVRTNMQIYWDRIELCALGPTPVVRELPVRSATLVYRGFAQEQTPNGKLPVRYDYDKLETVSVHPWKGRMTRYGDVTPLLAAVDDRHVVAGPGDEVTAAFDGAGLPPLPMGWVRSFVLRTHGYCKDTAPTTQRGGFVGPLPFRGMPTYPYAADRYPAHLAEYDREWNTRGR